MNPTKKMAWSVLLSEAPKIGKVKWESSNWDGNRYISKKMVTKK